MSDTTERTERATQKRREEARAQGRIPKSRDLVLALSLVGSFLLLRAAGGPVGDDLLGFVRRSFAELSTASELRTFDVHAVLVAGIGVFTSAVLPFALVALGVTIASFVVQGVFVPAPHLVLPRPARLHPLEGIRRTVRLESLALVGFALLKLALVAGFLWTAIASALVDPSTVTVKNGRFLTPEALSSFGLALACGLAGAALLDVIVQRWLYERSLRMTPAEVREEAQEMEGNSSVKRQRRRFSRSLQGAGHDRVESAPPLAGGGER